MKKKDIKVSVIVPVYNVAPYLERCLDSLVGQTLSDIEIICIDDKSTDNSLEILQEYKNKYPQIHVITLDKNSGVATARNTGIKAARGEYIGFVDSDDYIDADFYEKLYADAKQTGADIARGNLQLIDFNQKKYTCDQLLQTIKTCGKWYYRYQWWCAIYRTKLIKTHKISFVPDMTYGEDVLFLTECIYNANSVAVNDGTFYHYIRHPNSLDEDILPPHKISCAIQSYYGVAAIYNKAGGNISLQDYTFCYSDVMFRTYQHFARNTSLHCKQEIAEALIDMYSKCRNKRMVCESLGKLCGSHAIACIQSFDAAGLLKCAPTDTIMQATLAVRNKFYLFGIIPVCQTTKTPDRFIFRFCGLQILKIKPNPTDFRVWLFYIPVFRKKRRYN